MALKPCQTSARAPLALRSDAPLDRDPRQHRPRDEEGRSSRDEDRLDVGECDEQPGGERPEQGAEALDRRGGPVRGDQLAGRPRERRKQRDQRRPEQRRADADHGPGHEDDAPLIQQRAGSRDGEGRRSQQHEGEEEPLAPEAIAEGRGERRDRGCREQPQQARDADGRGSTVAVREHAERDEVRPLRRHQRAPGQLGATDVDVPSGNVKCAERLARTRREEPQPDAETGRYARVSRSRFTLRQ